MKYTIEGLQQQALIDLGLDCVDAVILRWIIDFRDTGKMRLMKIGTQEMFWINYGYMLEDIPIINIKNKDVLARRMMKICACGLMNKYVDKGAQGTYTYFNFNPDVLESLFHPMQESNPTRLLSRPPTRLESRPKDPSIKDNPNTNNTYTAPEGQGNEIVEINVEAVGKTGARAKHDNVDQLFEDAWVAFGKYGSKAKASNYWKRLSGKQRQAVIEAIPQYLRVVDAGRRKKCFEGWINPENKLWEQDWNQALREWGRTTNTARTQHTVTNATAMWS